MRVISDANESILEILAKFKKTAERYRLLHYVVAEPTEEGVLLFNLLTRELLLLSEDEYNNILEQEELKDRWFLVPEETKEKEFVGLLRWMLGIQQKKSKNITGYTIFSTTDCNARCFYCFELGCSRIPMTEETAHKTAKYIYEHCGGEKVHLNWFGGEPLYNQPAIDTICEDLRKMGVEFGSGATSNGYLFDKATVKKAVENWKLSSVQITLDGTEAVYNKIKAYIYKNTNPYQTVISNIGHLLDAGIAVQIRLNMDMHNADDLLVLVDELAERFRGRKNLFVYAHHIFKGNDPLAHSHTEEEWVEHERAMLRLVERIEQNGLSRRGGIKKHIKLNHCMADSGKSVTIAPNGDIGLCEHYTDCEFIGHIDSDQFDDAAVKSWKQTVPEIPECDTCFYYPDCIRLQKCCSSNVCFLQERNGFLSQTKHSMRNELQKFHGKNDQVENDDIQC